mgnify:CR=1 FL=1
MQGKDLLADILPPPAYIIESYLVAREMRDQQGAELDAARSRLLKLKQEYDERHAVWQAADLPPELRKALLEEADAPVAPFYALATGDYYAALRDGNAARAQEALNTLQGLYGAQRKAIDAVVNGTNRWNDALVGESRDFVTEARTRLGGATALALAVASAVKGPSPSHARPSGSLNNANSIMRYCMHSETHRAACKMGNSHM